MSDLVPALKPGLTPTEFGAVADLPPEIEWLANLTNAETRRAYKIDVSEFYTFAGLKDNERAQLAVSAASLRRDASGQEHPLQDVVKLQPHDAAEWPALAAAAWSRRDYSAAAKQMYDCSPAGSDEALPVLLAWALVERGRPDDAAPLLRTNPVPALTGTGPFLGALRWRRSRANRMRRAPTAN